MPQSEQYIVHEAQPLYQPNATPVLYIVVGQKICQMTPRLNLKAGDVVIIERCKVEQDSMSPKGVPKRHSRTRTIEPAGFGKVNDLTASSLTTGDLLAPITILDDESEDD